MFTFYKCAVTSSLEISNHQVVYWPFDHTVPPCLPCGVLLLIKIATLPAVIDTPMIAMRTTFGVSIVDRRVVVPISSHT